MSPPFRVLFLCTGNSARSQIAEALLAHLGGDRFEAASAGTAPAERVNPGALEVLTEAGIPWQGHAPRRVDGLEGGHWDLVVTVCDDARESCPVFPAGPVVAHWGMPDPAAVPDAESRRKAFAATLRVLRERIGELVALPVRELPRAELEARVRAAARRAQPGRSVRLLATSTPYRPLNIVESFVDLPRHSIDKLAPEQNRQIIEKWRGGYEALNALRAVYGQHELVGVAMADWDTVVDQLSNNRGDRGLARWAVLQMVEKLLKAYISLRDSEYGWSHNLGKLANDAEKLGLPPIDRGLLDAVQCSPGVR